MVQKVVDVSPADVGEFTSVATYLPVGRWRHVIAFFRVSGLVEQQLRKTEGIVRYGLKTDFLHKRFWTYSVWKDRKATQLETSIGRSRSSTQDPDFLLSETEHVLGR